jgi:hypothetical protein
MSSNNADDSEEPEQVDGEPAFFLRQIRYRDELPRIQDIPLRPPRGSGSENTYILTIGRHSENDIVVYHKDFEILTSKHHGFLSIYQNEVTLFDSGSTNGTKVNDVSVQGEQGVKLKVGDKILFGGPEHLSNKFNIFHFVFTDQPRAPPPQPRPRTATAMNAQQAALVTEDLLCPVCMECLLIPHAMGCGHVMCGDCACRALEMSRSVNFNKNRCPTCRADFHHSEHPSPCLALRTFIENHIEPYMEQDELAIRAERKEMWRNREDYVKRVKEAEEARRRQAEEEAQALAQAPAPVPEVVIVE